MCPVCGEVVQKFAEVVLGSASIHRDCQYCSNCNAKVGVPAAAPPRRRLPVTARCGFMVKMNEYYSVILGCAGTEGCSHVRCLRC